MFWQPLVGGLYYAVAGTLPGVEVPAWFLLVERLSPTMAYQVLVEAALDVPAQASIFSIRPTSATTVEQLGGGPVPAFLSAPISAVVLVLWVVIPTLIGYWRFRSSDL